MLLPTVKVIGIESRSQKGGFENLKTWNSFALGIQKTRAGIKFEFILAD